MSRKRKPTSASNPASGSRAPAKSKTQTAEADKRKYPISDSVRMEAVGETADAGRRAMAAINKAHDTGGNLIMGAFVEGKRSKREYGHYDPNTYEISLSQDAPHPELTAVHELGHKLHDHEFGFSTGETDSPHDQDLKPYFDAIKKLKTFKNLQKFRKKVQLPALSNHLRYLSSPKEVFARDYSHYIAVRSGDAKLLAQVEAERADIQQYGHHAYRTDEEMKILAPVFDLIFRGKGWL